jgi:hypothetical protein
MAAHVEAARESLARFVAPDGETVATEGSVH